MQNTITDRFAEKELAIGRRRAEIVAQYAKRWRKLIAEWNAPGTGDRVWLVYSANYLFRTAGVRWAIDPLTLRWRLKDAPKIETLASDLAALSFVLLTHAHKDHLDLDLIAALRDLPVTWVVPEFLLPIVMETAGLPHKNILVPQPLEPLDLHGIHILPFDGSHWEAAPGGGSRGVPALGYLIEADGKRWLFPGDTRTYDARQLPDCGPVDDLFAHLWLGRSCALMNEPPLVEAFCRFCFDLQPRRILLTHLNEFGRNANDFWEESHAEAMRRKLQSMESFVSIAALAMGESLAL